MFTNYVSIRIEDGNTAGGGLYTSQLTQNGGENST